jgi:hypothetical protein
MKVPKKPALPHNEEKQREADSRAAMFRKTEELALIIKPLATAKEVIGHDWSKFGDTLAGYEKEYGGLEMDPDFQRGHVWTEEQKQHYIENVLRGVVASSGFVVQFNCPNWDDFDYQGDLPRGFQCIDGLQRITAMFDFLSGKVKPFGLTPDDLRGSFFSVKGRYRFQVAIHTFSTREQLLQHYLDLNAGGTPHSAEEITRVRGLLESIRSAGVTAPIAKSSGGPSA